MNGGFLARVEGRRDRHGFLADLTYLSLEQDDAATPLGGSIRLELDSLILEGAYVYHFGDREGVEFGLRYWDYEVALTPALLPSVSRAPDWTDVFVGLRREADIGSNWRWLGRVNLGAGGSDMTGGLQLDFRRRFANGDSLTLGYRLLDYEYEDQPGAVVIDLATTLHGITVGYTFE